MHKKSILTVKRFVSNIRWCLSLSWKASAFYTLARIGSQILTPAFTIVASFAGKYVIDILASASADSMGILIKLLIILPAIALLRSSMQKMAQYCQTMHDDKINSRISIIMMDRALSVDLEYFDNPTYQDKIQTATRDSHSISNILWNVLSCVSAAISFLTSFVILCRANPFYGIVMLAAAIPSSIAAARYTKVLYDLSVDQMNALRQMAYCQGITSEKAFAQDLRLFNAGERLKSRYMRIWGRLHSDRKTITRRRALLTTLLECLPEIAYALIGLDIAFRVLSGNGTVGDYSLYIGLAAQLWSSISLLSSAVMQIYDNQLKIENIKALQTFENRVCDIGNESLDCIESIEFVDVSFVYPGTAVSVLDHINFALRKEEKLALVGLNGSGKTTLIKLLLRMYDPTCGVIRINGKDIHEYRLANLRACFSVYFQDMRNYCMPLQDNFTIADERRNDLDGAAKEALELAYAGDILEKATKGMETSVTRIFDTEGMELSGGQHQKLSLARAFYRRHSALILDEPSSNLDPKAEHEIFKSLSKLTEGKLTIFTSHRLSNVSLADRIIVLEKGRIVEDGTQKELLARKQKYAELFRYQQERYMVNEGS